MKKKASIIKLSIIAVVLVIGLVLSFVSFPISKTYDFHSFASSIKLGLDLKGGIYAVYQADIEGVNDVESSMDGTVASLEEVLIGKGYTEATVVREGNYRIRVEVPDVDSPQDILRILGEPAELEFYLVTEENPQTEPYETSEPFMTGDEVTGASVGQQNSDYGVSLNLNNDGANTFYEITGANVGSYIWIYTVIGGERTVISKATIQEAIPGNAFISMSGQTYDQAQELADRINSGTFSVTLSLAESSTISATLGENALNMGLLAGAIGFLLIIIFMCCFYRGFGALSSVGLLMYTVVMLFFMSVFPWVQLTLPGIAGILLSIGMAVDGNVVIFERIKDEYRNGKSIMSAFHYGYKKAAIAIFDSNVVTLIAAILLLIFGTGSIQGFAMTLLIGIVFSFLNSIFLTRFLIKQMININSTSEKLYNLKRGKGFENIRADENDAAVQRQIDDEQRKKEEEKIRKQKEKAASKLGGGTAE